MSSIDGPGIDESYWQDNPESYAASIKKRESSWLKHEKSDNKVCNCCKERALVHVAILPRKKDQGDNRIIAVRCPRCDVGIGQETIS